MYCFQCRLLWDAISGHALLEAPRLHQVAVVMMHGVRLAAASRR
jgi:hypothetical protein